MAARSKSPVLPPIRSSSQNDADGPRFVRPLALQKIAETPGPYNSKNLAIAAAKRRTYVLDFSHMELRSLVDAAKVEPRSGVVKKLKPVDAPAAAPGAKEKAKPILAYDLWGNVIPPNEQSDDEDDDNKLIVLRAKDETYAFKERVKTINDKDLQRFRIDANGLLVKVEVHEEEAVEKRYLCTSLRLNNNYFKSAAPLLRFVQTVAHEPLRHIAFIDLSCNAISEIPPVYDGLPLHTILLHQNMISRMSEVKKLQCLRSTLQNVTLNNNPIQSSVRNYKFAVLHNLPFLKFLDDVRVTVGDQQKLAAYEAFFVRKPRDCHNSYQGYLPPISRSHK